MYKNFIQLTYIIDKLTENQSGNIIGIKLKRKEKLRGFQKINEKIDVGVKLVHSQTTKKYRYEVSIKF